MSYREQICCQGVSPNDDDSERWPVGPYPDGGGESDSPEHCDHCGVFLENPLTIDGYDYVCQAVEEAENLDGLCPALVDWQPFYNV